MFDELVENVLADKRLAREEGIRIGTEEGREEGIRIGTEKAYREKLEEARRFKAKGIAADIIADCLNLDPELVKGL
jgi:predicted transposase YdaD